MRLHFILAVICLLQQRPGFSLLVFELVLTAFLSTIQRGGAGNFGGSGKPSERRPSSEDVIPEPAMREQGYPNFHTGVRI